MRILLVSLLMAATALAGCADEGPTAPVDDDDQKFDDVDLDKDKGVIRGIVIDPAIVPVQNAVVKLAGSDEETLTNGDGAFLFANIEPGTYFVSVSKLGYVSSQTSTEVVAGVEKPEILKIRLAFDETFAPYSQTYYWEGFMNCQIGFNAADVANNAINPCAALGLVDPSLDRIVEEYDLPTPTFVQSELVWEPSQALAGSMSLMYTRAVNLTELDNYARASGQSPVVISADGALLSNKGVGLDDVLRVRVFASSDTEATIIAQQGFEVFTTVFYGFEPEPGWTFTEDGEPVPPRV